MPTRERLLVSLACAVAFAVSEGFCRPPRMSIHRPISIAYAVPRGGPRMPSRASSPTAWGASLGHPIIVENVTGAGGSIGVGRAVQSETRWLHA